MLRNELVDLTENSKPFGVKGIGNFWPLEKTNKREIFYVQFFDIPPHYHETTTEELLILKGRGKITYGPQVHEPIFSLDSKGKKTSKWEDRNLSDTVGISPDSETFIIPPYTPHQMTLEKGFAYLGAILLCKPPLNPKDEINLRAR
ncbi:hypothetical protein A3K64_00895 [Candidatus Micrarchaeota archaeon RBG_16_36_9]|nr:MAG: hypothetical protein A3K64_00895 [Candidatus Micrarchaeota archaeon RBG_16_36_9]